jgi:alkaline phosphatase D
MNCIENGERIDQLIMCGDQIYADDLNVVGADIGVDQFNQRYRAVFTTEYIRRLMGQVPTYMMLDDHEIEDNWPESASKQDWVTKFPAAMHSYSTYQASHSPLFSSNQKGMRGTPTHLWYSYQDGCCDVFVLDTRTERLLKSDSPEILGPVQMKQLLRWLQDSSGRAKLIVTSVPPYESESSDKWHGFIEQRDQILECIRVNGVKKVVFVSGDVHACMSSQLLLGTDNLKVTSVVSSAFFWPYPHPTRRDFKLSGPILTNTGNQYEIDNASEVHPTDAFTKLTVNTSGLRIEFISRKGDPLGEVTYEF